MVYLPITANLLYACMIAVVFLVLLFSYLFSRDRLKIHPTILSWVFFYVALGAGFITYGLVTGAPGALFSCLVYVVYPCVYAVFIAAATGAGIWINLLRILVLATIAIDLGTFEFALWALGRIPDSLYVAPHVVDAIRLSDGLVQMRHYSLGSLIFVVPFLMAALVVYGDRCPPILPKKVLWLGLLLGMGSALLGGRRALLIVVAIAPLLVWFFRAQLPRRVRVSGKKRGWRIMLGVAALVVAATVGLGFFVDLNWHGIMQLVLSGFDTRLGYAGATDRWNQYYALMHGWASHPLFGKGLGSFTPEVIRSDRPWQYELQYALLLFQTGLVGIILYSAGVVWLYWTGIKLIRSGSRLGIHMVPVLVGTTCFLVANSVEPYLQAFCQDWTIFLPVGLINCWRLSTETTAHQDPLRVTTEVENAGFWDHLLVLAKRKFFILKFVGTAAVLATGISFLLPETYTANARVLPPMKNQAVTTANATLVRLSSLAAQIRSGLGLPNPNYIYTEMLRSRTVADDLIERFSLKRVYRTKLLEEARRRLGKHTDIIEEDGMIYISVEDRDPQRAADLANGYVEELQSLSQKLAESEAGRRRLFYELEVTTARKELATAEQAMKRTEESTGIVELDSQSLVTLGIQAGLKARVAAQELQVQVMRSFVTPENPELVRAEQELAALRGQLAGSERGRGKRLIADVAVKDLPSAGLEYVRKLREVKYRESLYTLLAMQYEIARIDEGREAFLIPSLDKAVRPERYSWPQRYVISVVATVLALLVAVLAAFLMETIERAKENLRSLARWRLLKTYLFKAPQVLDKTRQAI